jgi:hypothetical protein
MYVELGMGTRHAMQGSGTVVFWMDSGDVLSMTDVLCVLELKRSVFPVLEIEKKGCYVLFRDGPVLFVPKGSSFKSSVVLGVRESNLYRIKGQPMRTMANSSRVIDVKEQVALKFVETQRELDFRGSQQIQREFDFRGTQETQRESQPLRGSQPSGSDRREESSKTVRKVSWVEEGRQEAQKREGKVTRTVGAIRID